MPDHVSIGGERFCGKCGDRMAAGYREDPFCPTCEFPRIVATPPLDQGPPSGLYWKREAEGLRAMITALKPVAGCQGCGVGLNEARAENARDQAGDGPLLCGGCRDAASLKAENERLKADIVDMAVRLAEAGSRINLLRWAMHDADALLTPGMKAGVAEAKARLNAALAEDRARVASAGAWTTKEATE